jgi:hypothetical protein
MSDGTADVRLLNWREATLRSTGEISDYVCRRPDLNARG